MEPVTSDPLGDQLDGHDDERQLLVMYRPWLRKVATAFPATLPSRTEDLAQEGWIEVWRVAHSLKDTDQADLPDDVDRYLKRCAVNRMTNVFNSWTAQRRDVYKTVYVDFSSVYEDETWESYLANVALVTDLGEIEWAYHHGEILAAVNRLPRSQRAYVVRRFWNNWAPESLDIYFTNAKATWRSARDNLRRDLAYLMSDETMV